MMGIISFFAIRFYSLLVATILISLLLGKGELAILSGIFSAIGAVLWVVNNVNKEVLGLKRRLNLLLFLIFSTLFYPLLVIYLIYIAKNMINFTIPLILYFVSSFILAVIFLLKTRGT